MSITRATICASPGHRLFAADYSGVEARVVAWLAGEQREIDQWAKFDRTRDPKNEPYYITGDAAGLNRDKIIPAKTSIILRNIHPRISV
jgi:hypothetical protein